MLRDLKQSEFGASTGYETEAGTVLDREVRKAVTGASEAHVGSSEDRELSFCSHPKHHS